MKVGFIGAGRMTQRRLDNLPVGWEPVAIYTHDKITDRYAGRDIDALLVPSPAEVIDQSDLVIVATPHVYLNDYAWQIYDAGKRVFVEKPGGIPGDKPLPPCKVGYNHRFWPGIQVAKHAITGEILHIRGVYGHGNADRLWRMDPKLSGGGEFLDQGSHLIDLTRFFVGDVMLSHAMLTTGTWDTELEDTAHFILRAGITVIQHSVSWCEWAPIFRFEIITKNEKIVVEGFPWQRQTITVTNRNGTSRWIGNWQKDHSLRLELSAKDGATSEDAQAVLVIIGEAYG